MMETANSAATEAPATTENAVIVKPVVQATPEQLRKIYEMNGEIKEMRAALKDKEAELAALERDAGITRASKVKAAVIGGVKTTGETLASVGSTIKKGSIKLASKAGSAFKGKETDDKHPADDSKPAGPSFGTKLRAARDGFTASIMRATTRSPTVPNETPAAPVAGADEPTAAPAAPAALAEPTVEIGEPDADEDKE